VNRLAAALLGLALLAPAADAQDGGPVLLVGNKRDDTLTFVDAATRKVLGTATTGRGLTGAGPAGLGSGCCAEAAVESASAAAATAVMIGARREDAGIDVTGWPLERRARGGLGRSFQNARLFPAMSVRENVLLAMHRHLDARNPLLAAVWAPPARREERRAVTRVDDTLELLGLSGYADSFVGDLSTGTRRAVDVACLMVAAPQVLLLDEPSSGLAQAETEALGPVILRLVRETGCAVLLIEHDLPLATSVCDRLIAMELGRVLTTGTPSAVLADERVQRAYLAASREVVVRSGAHVSDALAAAGFTTEGMS